MSYLIGFDAIWLLASVLVGAVVGWLSYSRTPGRTNWFGGWFAPALLVFMIVLVVSAMKLLPAVLGYWLDLAVLFFGAYLIGCFVGSFAHALIAPAESAVALAIAEPVTPVLSTPVSVKSAVAPVSAATAAVATHPGTRPPEAATTTGHDDLKMIKGIGPVNEKALNALGIYTFYQIAAWTPAEAEWVGHHLAFPGRIERELWIDQAKILCAGGETEHSVAVRHGLVVTDQPLTDSHIADLKSDLPLALAPVEGEDNHHGLRPFGMAAARGGAGDDLRLIKGIGTANEAHLHALGIWHYSQIAAWTHANIEWVGSFLSFPGRIEKEDWVGQARVLAAGKPTEFAERVRHGDVENKKDEAIK